MSHLISHDIPIHPMLPPPPLTFTFLGSLSPFRNINRKFTFSISTKTCEHNLQTIHLWIYETFTTHTWYKIVSNLSSEIGCLHNVSDMLEQKEKKHALCVGVCSKPEITVTGTFCAFDVSTWRVLQMKWKNLLCDPSMCLLFQ